MARVLLLTLVFPPDNVSTAHLMGEVARDLEAAGHTLTVLSTTPHYNPDATALARQPLANVWGRVLQRSDFHGITVYHTLMPRKGRSPLLRVLSWGLFHALSLVAGVTVVGRVDVIITPSPPLTMGLASWVLSRLRGAPYIYSVLELHPDIAISLGLVRNRLLIRLLYGLERFVYRGAAHITVIAEAMRRRIAEKGVDPAKVTLIPNFVDTSERLVEPRPNAFSVEHHLDGKFVVVYAGNVGPAQGLEALVEAARLVRDDTRIRIVIVGGGISWDTLSRQVREAALDNVLMLPHQPFDAVPAIYGTSDLCVVSQSATTASDAVPSKVYRIMGAERPVLAITVPGSDLEALVETSECGAIAPADDPAEIARQIRQAVDAPDRWRSRGLAGRAHVEQFYSRQVVTARYRALVERCTSPPPGRPAVKT